MKKSVVIRVVSDPLTTPKAAEAVRLAAGLASCGGIAVRMELGGAAFSKWESMEEWMDGDVALLARPLLAEHGVSISKFDPDKADQEQDGARIDF